jgi:hypothetical protein
VIGTLAAFALREALRRRVFMVVAVLTVAFLALYALGVWQAFKIAGNFGGGFAGVDPDVRKCCTYPDVERGLCMPPDQLLFPSSLHPCRRSSRRRLHPELRLPKSR